VLLRDVVDTSRALRDTRSRLEKVARLAECLRRLEPAEIPIGVAYLSGTLPGGRIGVGWAGVAEVRRGSASTTPELSLLDTQRALDALAALEGSGSAGERTAQLGGLFARATEAEQEFLGRLLVGELRQGASRGLMVEALAKASEVPASQVRRALTVAGELGRVAVVAFAAGSDGLARLGIQLFRPVLPMLAQPADDVASALELLGEASFEFKLDGARIQVHKADEQVRVFSRHRNEVTDAVPEIVETVAALPLRSVILDGEVLALRPDGSPQPFQVTMSRFGGRLDVARRRRELPLSCFFFDCLALDGQSLLERGTAERGQALAAVLPAPLQIPRLVTSDSERADAFWQEALARGHEGLMAKALDAPYAAGGRGKSWLKLKTAHTLDLVVLAAEWGSGRRRGWLSNLHLGARDPHGASFVMLGKTFKGLTDELLAWQTQRLEQLEIARDRHTVYVRPELVVEIAFNDVQASSHYPGGVALRFARVKRYRGDKSADQADTIERVRALLPDQRRSSSGGD
jgi:DNA ligase-1